MSRFRTAFAAVAIGTTLLATPATFASANTTDRDLRNSSTTDRDLRNSTRSVASSTAEAAAIVTYGPYCGGTEIRRCVWVNVDRTNHRMRAYSSVTDVSGGRNFEVATRSIRLFIGSPD